ncbi:MAG: hypothetical protein K1X72_01050 [Pyrinomonadaceae bacterium]|nr:hypothetical protein [Pyrinomonadaceae bacterium]
MKRKLKVTITKIRRIRIGCFGENLNKKDEQKSDYLTESEKVQIIREAKISEKTLEKIRNEMFLKKEH